MICGLLPSLAEICANEKQNKHVYMKKKKRAPPALESNLHAAGYMHGVPSLVHGRYLLQLTISIHQISCINKHKINSSPGKREIASFQIDLSSIQVDV
jgi:hypothetical protein